MKLWATGILLVSENILFNYLIKDLLSFEIFNYTFVLNLRGKECIVLCWTVFDRKLLSEKEAYKNKASLKEHKGIFRRHCGKVFFSLNSIFQYLSLIYIYLRLSPKISLWEGKFSKVGIFLLLHWSLFSNVSSERFSLIILSKVASPITVGTLFCLLATPHPLTQ